MRALKKIMAALALTAVLAGCSADNILSSIQGGKADTVQTVSRPAVESAELQFTHPAAGDTIAVFDTSAGVFKAVLFSTEAPQAVQNFTTLAQQGLQRPDRHPGGEGLRGGGRAGRGRQRHHHLEREPFLRRDHR